MVSLMRIGTVCAQFTDLHNFNDTSGSYPSSPLVISGKTMFGATPGGGLYGTGIIYSLDTNGNNFKVLYTFDTTFYYSANSGPYGGLTLLGSKLYGATNRLGLYGDGNIFSIDTDGSNYKDLFDLNDTDGQYPSGYLVYSYGKLYGMTPQGGANGYGVIFSIDTSGSHYRDLLDFNGINGSQGNGSLTIINNKIYGPTWQGGIYNRGTLFSLDTNGAAYKKLHDFNDTDGAAPAGGLAAFNNKLYGIAEWKGANAGYIFSIDTSGSNYKNIYRLNDSNVDINTSLLYNNGVLYGMSDLGGNYQDGSLFALDTDGSNYKEFFSFNHTDGGNLEDGKLTLYGNTLYGVAYQGGPFDYFGVVFKYSESEVTTSVKELTATKGLIHVYPNPSNGNYEFQITNYEAGSANIEVYNVLGQQVYSKQAVISNSQFVIELNQPSGVYLYRVIANSGEVIGEGKLVIQK